MSEKKIKNDISKLKPWNSKENPVKVNSIRYNQDYTLLTLGTSKGYKVFFTEDLKLCQEESEEIKNLGDINIAMAYYKSSLVFFLPNKDNQIFTNKEIIIYDDFYQSKISSFKVKNEEILNFFIIKNSLYIITVRKIIVIELFSFKVIEIIEGINSSNKLISFNFFDFLGYTELDNKKNIHIINFQNENYKIVSKTRLLITTPYDFIQIIQLSQSGLYIGAVAIYGNKMHIYYTKTGKLKECIFLGPNIQTMEKMTFSKKENYIFFQKKDSKFMIYKLEKNSNNNPKCICDKYDDKKLLSLSENNNGNKSGGVFSFMRRPSRMKDVKEIHAFGDYEGKLLFVDFDKTINTNKNTNKDLIFINHNGELIKYHFNKKKSGNISPVVSIQWI